MEDSQEKDYSFLGNDILSFLYARSGQGRNRIFNANKLFLKRFANVITK